MSCAWLCFAGSHDMDDGLMLDSSFISGGHCSDPHPGHMMVCCICSRLPCLVCYRRDSFVFVSRDPRVVMMHESRESGNRSSVFRRIFRVSRYINFLFG